jgi:hypothetical protein
VTNSEVLDGVLLGRVSLENVNWNMGVRKMTDSGGLSWEAQEVLQKIKSFNRQCEATLKSHFAQSARADALTVSPHTQVQVSLSSFTPTFCNVPLPELMVHCPDTTCSELSLQCASQMVF